MNAVLDYFLVAVVLLASVSYALYKLGPRNLRKRIHALFKLKTAVAGEVRGACGGCDNCGDAERAPQSPASEVHIPAANIGRRS